MSDIELIEALKKKIEDIASWHRYLKAKMSQMEKDTEDIAIIANAMHLRLKDKEEKKQRKKCLFRKLCCRGKCHED